VAALRPMPPSRVADMVFDAIQDERFYILTHPEWMEVIQMKTDDLRRTENPRDPAQVIMQSSTSAGSDAALG
jgi:hypothetical protein